MEKLCFVLRAADSVADDEWAERVRRAVADDLPAEGVLGATAHVRDSATREVMMRFEELDPPMAAMVSCWVHRAYGPELAAAVIALSAVAEVVNGYLVTESLPLPFPDTEIGSRTEGFANIALLRRPPELPHEQWRRTWHESHTGVALATQATTGYEQNMVVRPVTADAPEIAAIVVEQFPMAALTDPMAWYGASDQADLTARIGEMAKSVTAFGAVSNLDTVATSRYQF